MKIVQGFIVRKIVDQSIVVPVGFKNVGFHTMISLNNSGAFLWQQLQTEKTEDDLLSAILEEYDIDETIALEDVRVFITKLKKAEALE